MLPFESRKEIRLLTPSHDGRLLVVLDVDGRALLVNLQRRVVLHRFNFKKKVEVFERNRANSPYTRRKNYLSAAQREKKWESGFIFVCVLTYLPAFLPACLVLFSIWRVACLSVLFDVWRFSE